MCSIYGIVASNAADLPAADVVERMGAVTRHRGPDDRGLYQGDGVILGIRRLAVIDVAGGHQPISNEDDTVWAVCNGEIYNFRPLRRQLEQRGHRFRTDSDTEVVVHAYEEYGREFIGHLSGMFGVAVWDVRKRTLFLGRDRLGIKPLYCLQQPGRLVFASEAKAILEVPGTTTEIDPSALRQYLALGYVPAPLCGFSGMRKLPPASRLEVRDGMVSIERYWTPPAPIVEDRNEADWADAVRSQIERAVVSQMVSDVPIGAFLSGGVDSSAVIAFMARNSSAPIRTYSVGFDDALAGRLYNELPYARRIASHFGTTHKEIIVRPDVARLLPALIWHMDEPIADSALITTYLVAEFARADVTVALSGLGGDELFGGYVRYLADYFDGYYRMLPASLRDNVLRPLARLLPAGRHSRLLNFSRLARHFILADGSSLEQRYRSMVGVFSYDSIAELCLLDEPIGDDALAQAFGRAAQGDTLQRLSRVDLETQLPDDLLMLTDKMTMAASLECRVPFLDQDLVELAARIPSHLKIRGRRRKYILSRALEGLVPVDILQREKRGFGAPLGWWFKNELAPLTRCLLGPEPVRRRGLLRPESVAKIVAMHENTHQDQTDRLIALVSLELWCRIYQDRRTPDDVATEIAASLAN